VALVMSSARLKRLLGEQGQDQEELNHDVREPDRRGRHLGSRSPAGSAFGTSSLLAAENSTSAARSDQAQIGAEHRDDQADADEPAPPGADHVPEHAGHGRLPKRRQLGPRHDAVGAAA